MVFAGICVFVVPKNYETAYFLNDEDKALMRIRAEEMEAYSGGSGHYTRKEMNYAAKDLKTWAHSIIQICVVTILYGEHTPSQYSAQYYGVDTETLQVSARSCPSSSRTVSSTLPSRRSISSSRSTSGAPSCTPSAPCCPIGTRHAFSR